LPKKDRTNFIHYKIIRDTYCDVLTNEANILQVLQWVLQVTTIVDETIAWNTANKILTMLFGKERGKHKNENTIHINGIPRRS